MNSILDDMRQIVWAAAPELKQYGPDGPARPGPLAGWLGKRAGRDLELWRKLWANIKPVKFGNEVSWIAAGPYTFARYQVPRNFLTVVLRADVYTVNWTAAATDLGRREPPPPGSAWWQYESLGSTLAQVITDKDAPIQLACAEEFLLFRGGYFITLNANVTAASPNGNTRLIRTVVYGYNVGADIADRLGGNQAIIEIP